MSAASSGARLGLRLPRTPSAGAGIDDTRQATYQRKFSTLLAGLGKAGA
jgi:hypothetical protein